MVTLRGNLMEHTGNSEVWVNRLQHEQLVWTPSSGQYLQLNTGWVVIPATRNTSWGTIPPAHHPAHDHARGVGILARMQLWWACASILFLLSWTVQSMGAEHGRAAVSTGMQKYHLSQGRGSNSHGRAKPLAKTRRYSRKYRRRRPGGYHRQVWGWGLLPLPTCDVGLFF